MHLYMFFKFFLHIILVFFLINCSGNSNNQKDKIVKNESITPESQYIKAMNKFNNQELEEAKTIFKNIEQIYPLSNEAIQSQIMMGFIDYSKLEYESAIIKFTKLIKKYPSLKNIDYVYYMKALCYYEQITHEELDGQFNLLALENLNQVVNRFPDSKYTKDSYQKIILVKSNIAAKHMKIGRFYQKANKYTAALNRYKIVINDFSETKFTPEALYRISEIYYSIGMVSEATDTAAILGYNYPQSEWYEFSYKNLVKEENSNIFSNSINKIFNK